MSKSDREICEAANLDDADFMDISDCAARFNIAKLLQMLDESDAKDNRLAAAHLEFEGLHSEIKAKDKRIEELEEVLGLVMRRAMCDDDLMDRAEELLK